MNYIYRDIQRSRIPFPSLPTIPSLSPNPNIYFPHLLPPGGTFYTPLSLLGELQRKKKTRTFLSPGLFLFYNVRPDSSVNNILGTSFIIKTIFLTDNLLHVPNYSFHVFISL